MKKFKEKAIPTMVSLTPTEQEAAKKVSIDLLGRENVSGLFRFWLNQYLKANEAKENTKVLAEA